MSRQCIVTKKAVLTGNNVSHANNKTRRRFLPNLQELSLFSDTLKQNIRVRISTQGLRTIDFHGGIDRYVLSTRNSQLDSSLLKLKKLLIKKGAHI
jgi:large subunit ribosomal protein L28